MMTTFPVSSGLLSGEHYARIGLAVWEFLWLIDRTTEEIEEDGERWGKVLRGNPIRAEDIASVLQIHPSTVKRHLNLLRDQGYIRTRRLSKGLIIDVRKSIKWLMRSHEGQDIDLSPSNQTLVAELVTRYRAIPGVGPNPKDNGVFGQAVKEYGVEVVNHALDDFTEQCKTGTVENPIRYLFGILKKKKQRAQQQDIGSPVSQQDDYFRRQDVRPRDDCPECNGTGKIHGIDDFTGEERIIICKCCKRKVG